jgi:hypothetical protein
MRAPQSRIGRREHGAVRRSAYRTKFSRVGANSRFLEPGLLPSQIRLVLGVGLVYWDSAIHEMEGAHLDVQRASSGVRQVPVIPGLDRIGKHEIVDRRPER